MELNFLRRDLLKYLCHSRGDVQVDDMIEDHIGNEIFTEVFCSIISPFFRQVQWEKPKVRESVSLEKSEQIDGSIFCGRIVASVRR